MHFDIMNLFEEKENVITELDEGNEVAAVDFANRILSMSPSCSATESYTVYQDDAFIRYAPVSYTHLDVYKRQPEKRMWCRLLWSPL